MTQFAPFDAADYLDDEATIAAYISAALDDPNPDVFLTAVRDVARARGMTQLAKPSPASSGRALIPFLALVVCAALFVGLSCQDLPDIVASHFDASGRANGFMPRRAYTVFMLAIVVGAPLVLALMPMRAFRNPRARTNLPNRAYWLAPERRAATIDVLSTQAVRFATVVLVFLCYAHWLVVRAHALTPPALSTPRFMAGLVVFLLVTLAWTVALIRRFTHLPHSREG